MTDTDLALCLHCQRVIEPRPSRLTEGATVWELSPPIAPGSLVCWKRPGISKSHEPAPSLAAQVEEALAEIETGIKDSRGDFPDLHDDDRCHEIATSVLFRAPRAVQVEVQRRLGFSPADF